MIDSQISATSPNCQWYEKLRHPTINDVGRPDSPYQRQVEYLVELHSN